MSKLRLRAPLACRIANVDRDRFNEAVARGDYPCAPGGGPGRARLFSLNDVIALCIYGRLVAKEVASKQAGRTACKIANLAKAAEGYESAVGITIVHEMNGLIHECATLNVTTKDLFGDEDKAKADPDAEAERLVKRVAELKMLRAKIQTETHLEVASPSVLSLTMGQVVWQETWQLLPIVQMINREIEEYRNTLGEEETLG